MAATDPLKELSKKVLGVLLDGIDTWIFWRGFILSLAVSAYGAYELGYITFWEIAAPISRQVDEVAEYEEQVKNLKDRVGELERSVEGGHSKIVSVIAFFALAPSASAAFDYEGKMECSKDLSNVELNPRSRDAIAMKQHDTLEHYCNAAAKEYEDYKKIILGSGVKDLNLERLEILTRPSLRDATKLRIEVKPRKQGDRIPKPQNPDLKRLEKYPNITDI